MARNIILSRRDWVRYVATFSGGSWLSLSNLTDHNPQLVAEAVNNTPSSTKFRVNFGAPRRIGVIFFANLRATTAGMLRVWASVDGVTPVWDSGTVRCWPVDSVPGGTNPWGVTTTTGVYNAEFYTALGFTRFLVPDATFSASYMDVEIDDSSNPNPLQIGRFGACEIWEAPRNMQFGWQIAVIDESQIASVPGGSTYITPRGLRRRLSFGLNYIDHAEAMARQIDLAMVLGQRAPMIAVPFPDAGGDIEKTAIYGRVSRDPEITNPLFGLYSQTFQIDQLI